MMTPQNARIWYISRKSRTTKRLTLSMRRIRSIKQRTNFRRLAEKSRRHCALFAELNPYIPDDFSLIKSDKKYAIQS